MMHHIVLWKWAQAGARREYDAHHVNRMVAMLDRNLSGLGYRILCITDDARGIDGIECYPLWAECGDIPNYTQGYLPSCYRRLKLYDVETQRQLDIKSGDRIVSIDLDTLVCGPLQSLLQTEGRFVGWGLPGSHHPLVFNGSFQMFSAGDLQAIWSMFDPEQSPREASDAGFKGSDQAWLSWNLMGAKGSVALGYPLISSYPVQNRILGHVAPETRLVFFHGQEKPWSPEAQQRSPWIKRYWRD